MTATDVGTEFHRAPRPPPLSPLYSRAASSGDIRRCMYIRRLRSFPRFRLSFKGEGRENSRARAFVRHESRGNETNPFRAERLTPEIHHEKRKKNDHALKIQATFSPSASSGKFRFRSSSMKEEEEKEGGELKPSPNGDSSSDSSSDFGKRHFPSPPRIFAVVSFSFFLSRNYSSID